MVRAAWDVGKGPLRVLRLRHRVRSGTLSEVSKKSTKTGLSITAEWFSFSIWIGVGGGAISDLLKSIRDRDLDLHA
jgi:hypothetical protein